MLYVKATAGLMDDLNQVFTITCDLGSLAVRWVRRLVCPALVLIHYLIITQLSRLKGPRMRGFVSPGSEAE